MMCPLKFKVFVKALANHIPSTSSHPAGCTTDRKDTLPEKEDMQITYE